VNLDKGREDFNDSLGVLVSKRSRLDGLSIVRSQLRDLVWMSIRLFTHQHRRHIVGNHVDNLRNTLRDLLHESQHAGIGWSASASTYRALDEDVDDGDGRDHVIRAGREIGESLDVVDDRGRVDGSDEAGEGSEGNRGKGEELHDDDGGWVKVGSVGGEGERMD
jgi:hypothetical protein